MTGSSVFCPRRSQAAMHPSGVTAFERTVQSTTHRFEFRLADTAESGIFRMF